MQVNLIDYTGLCSPDPYYAAKLLIYTKSTRLTQGEDTKAVIDAMGAEAIETELSYIANTIRSSWEFVDYTFQIQGVSRAFTHQFVRTRTGSYAQQSMRSLDMGSFDYVTGPSIEESPDLCQFYSDGMEFINELYSFLIEQGAQVEDARGVLPTNICTSIIVKFNLRTIADLCGKRENPRAQNEYTKVFKGMMDEVLRVHPWAEQFIRPDRSATPALDAIIKELLGGKTPFTVPEANAALKELDKLKGVWG